MVTISTNIETALIEGQTFVRTQQIKRIIADFNSDSGNTKAELFILGVELGRLFEHEIEHSIHGGDFETHIFSIIKEIEKSLM